MAELQAAAAAANLLAELDGRVPSHIFRVELMCILDTLDSGMFIWRAHGMSVMLPPLSGMHWLKRMYEWWFLRRLIP
jgi:sulfide:quinone oxidoreductase